MVPGEHYEYVSGAETVSARAAALTQRWFGRDLLDDGQSTTALATQGSAYGGATTEWRTQYGSGMDYRGAVNHVLGSSPETANPTQSVKPDSRPTKNFEESDLGSQLAKFPRWIPTVAPYSQDHNLVWRTTQSVERQRCWPRPPCLHCCSAHVGVTLIISRATCMPFLSSPLRRLLVDELFIWLNYSSR